jgi:hypothetical protein
VDEFSKFQRLLWGVAGGGVAVAVKFMGQDIYWLRVLNDTRAADQLRGMIVFYIVLTLILCFVGAVAAMASKENSEMKLLVMAISFPALATTYMGGAKADIGSSLGKLTSLSIIGSAQAADATIPSASTSNSSKFWEGFLLPLGYGKDDQRYRVVVGSYKDKTAAEAKAADINKTDPSLNASVGDRRLFNDYYPVVVGKYAVYPQASALKAKVKDQLGIDDAYLAPYEY